MLAKNIIAALTMAAAASASPVLEVRNDAPAPPACSATTPDAKCCQNVVNSLLDLVGLGVGVGCVDILGNSCSAQTTCCAPGTQFGLINVQLVCTLTNV